MLNNYNKTNIDQANFNIYFILIDSTNNNSSFNNIFDFTYTSGSSGSIT